MRRKIIGLITLLMMIIGLASCSNGGVTYQSGYFMYKLNKETNEAMLIALTEEGQQQETLVIPTMIDGNKVTTIGHALTYGDGTSWHAYFESEKLKNIYFPSTMVNTQLHSSFYKDLVNINKVYWGGTKFSSSLVGYVSTDINIFTSQINFDNNHYISDERYSRDGIKYFSHILVSNVVYYLNDDTEDTFFVDNVEDSVVNVLPPDPIREGYTFNGWYKEKECINKWDFENDIAPKAIFDENNNILNETKIYAGWE